MHTHTNRLSTALYTLLPVTTRSVGATSSTAVSARDLHRFLEVAKDFSDWVKVQVDRARLMEHRDYEVFPFLGGKSSGRPKVEYALTLDAAKHIAMLSGTDRGFEAREYFLECEQRANDPVHALLAMSRSDVLNMAARLARKQECLQATIAILEPKAAFYDAVSEIGAGVDLKSMAKLLGTGRTRICEWLRKSGVFMASGPIPYQRFIEAGYFRLVETFWTDRVGRDQLRLKALVTGKGQIWLQKRWASQQTDVAS